MTGPQLHRYGDDASQVGDLWLPAGGEPAPVAVLLHGGYWRARYGRDLMRDLSHDLARRGFVAWNLEYRRLRRLHPLLRSGGWPATFLDVAAGIDHLAELARAGAPVDLGRVAAIGHSAGGHLALWAAARPGLPTAAPGAAPRVKVTHAVAQAGVLDLEEAERLGLGGGAAARLLGGSPRRHGDRYVLASPARRLPMGRPQLMVHGERDETVPVAMSRRYHASAQAAGDPAQLVVLPADGHYEHLDPGSPAWAAVVGFLEEMG